MPIDQLVPRSERRRINYSEYERYSIYARLFNLSHSVFFLGQSCYSSLNSLQLL